MNAKLKVRFQRLEDDRQELTKLLKQQPEAVLNRRIRPGKWTINEILMHLLTAERMTAAYMKKKALGISQLGNSGLLEASKIGLLVLSQQLPLRYRAPAVVRSQTPAPVPLNTLSDEWDATRIQLAEVLDNIGDDHLRRLIYRHPVVGLLDAGQCLTFMHAHFHHHLPQITRLL